MNGRTAVRRIAAALLACVLAAAAAAAEGTPETGAEAGTEAAAEAAYGTLKRGARGEAVARLQERLNELGYDAGGADGIFGAGTQGAVKAFQRRSGLEADGIAGPATQAALYAPDAPAAPGEEDAVDTLAGRLPVLVNRKHPVDAFFTPKDLVELSDVLDSRLVKIKYRGLRAVRTAAEALEKMLEAARDDGVTKWQVSAAFRTWEDQESMLNARISSYLKKNKGWSRSRARSAALHTVAEPGSSEHHLGLAIDINVPGASSFAGTKQCRWLHAHCHEYGFIVRYTKEKESITGFSAEAWHIRYVGIAHARYMTENNLCLEEYLEGIEAGSILPPAEEETEDVMLD